MVNLVECRCFVPHSGVTGFMKLADVVKCSLKRNNALMMDSPKSRCVPERCHLTRVLCVPREKLRKEAERIHRAEPQIGMAGWSR